MLSSSSPQCFSDLIQATQDTNVNVPQMADTLMERAGNASWVVVFKALITTHHLMVHGNEVSLKHSVYTQPDDMLSFLLVLTSARMQSREVSNYLPSSKVLYPSWSTDQDG